MRPDRLRPHQGRRLGEIADEIVGPAEQHGIGPAGHQLAHQAGLGVGEAQGPGQRRQPPAAIGVRHGAEIVDQDQRHLGVALRRVEQAVEEFGERLHEVSARSEVTPA